MSVTERLKQGFLRLPSTKKAILLGSGALMLSPFLPWYDNRNTFDVGDVFLGIQGPLFATGIAVGVLGAISFFNLFLPLLGRNFFKLKKKTGLVALLTGGQSLVLMLVASSVFFHPLFGTNVSHKGTHFGMLVAFGAVFTVILSGLIAHRKEQNGGYPEPAVNTWEPKQAATPVEPEIQSYGEVLQSPQVRPVATTPAFQRNIIGGNTANPQPVSGGLKQTTTRNRNEQVSAYHGARLQIDDQQTNTNQANQSNSSSYTNQRILQELQQGNTHSQSQSVRRNTPEPMTPPNGDPLQMDAKTRYKLMKQKMRMQANEQGNTNANLWGGASSNGQAYGGQRPSRLP